MMRVKGIASVFVFLIFLITGPVMPLSAQALLEKRISLDLEQTPLKHALSEISRQGDFYFSYNSSILPEDSLVDVQAGNQRIYEMLRGLLGSKLAFKESGRYIILGAWTGARQTFSLSGRLYDADTGQPLDNASVYLPALFRTTLSDTSGYFNLRYKSRAPDLQVGISRAGYKDTLFHIPAGNQQVRVPLTELRSITLPEVEVVASDLDTMWLSRLFISSRQKIRDVNLGAFFVRQPFQYSVWPGIGTHGKMSAQSVNKFSFNILGGYAGGVNGFELGGLFNLNKDHVERSLQIAGLFNVVGGDVSGVQIAGFYNNTGGAVSGLQIGGVVNKARSLLGLQIGMVNILDSSGGYSMGLVNIVKNQGYYKLAVSSDESNRVRLAFKSGRKAFYNIVLLSGSTAGSRRAFSVGYGLGSQMDITQKLSLTTEASGEAFLTGYRNDSPVLARLQPALHWRIGRKISLFAGPSLALYFPGRSLPVQGRSDPIPPGYAYSFSPKFKVWPGFQAGLQIF